MAFTERPNRFSIGKAVISAGTGLPSAEVEGIVDHAPTAYVVAQGVLALGLPASSRKKAG
jgi:hypothetical protein